MNEYTIIVRRADKERCEIEIEAGRGATAVMERTWSKNTVYLRGHCFRFYSRVYHMDYVWCYEYAEKYLTPRTDVQIVNLNG